MENKIAKELSIGTIITDGQYILGCRPYGRKASEHSYDLPKGHWEEGETYIETAIRECKEETGFELWADHLTDLGKYEYLPTKDLYIFLVGLDFMPELDTLKCSTYFELNHKQVPEVVDYKLIPITELQWFFKSLEPLVAKALEVFDSRIEEDEEAIVALPKHDSDSDALQEKQYHARDTGFRQDLINPIIYRDAPLCKHLIQSSEALVSTPGPNIIDHVKEHKNLFGVSPENLWYAEIKQDIVDEQQAQLLTVPKIKKKIHHFKADIFDLLAHMKSNGQKIGMIDFDGTDSSYLTTETVDKLLSYSDCVFLAGSTRNMQFIRRGHPGHPIRYPSGGRIPVRNRPKTKYIQWLDSLYRRGYKFSATSWTNNSDPESKGAQMLGILFCPSLTSSSLKLVLRGNSSGETFIVHEYSFEMKRFLTV